MIHTRSTRPASALVAIVLVGAFLWPAGRAQAGALDLLGGGATKLVAPLAKKFGVPADAVTKLMGSGLSLDGVVQTLLVNQASGAGLDKVTGILGSNHNDVGATATALGVDPSAYAQDKVSAVESEVTGAAATGQQAVGSVTSAPQNALDQATGTAQGAADQASGAAQGAANQAAGAGQNAVDKTTGAVNKALGGY